MSSRESVNEEYMPNWMKEKYTLRIPWKKDGMWRYIAPDLAFQDLSRGTDLVGQIASISPLIKGPIEWAANVDIFRRRRLADPDLPPSQFAWEKARKEIMNNLRIAGVFSRLDDSQKSTLDKILRELLGLYVYAYDPNMAKREYQKKVKKQKAAVQRLEKKRKGQGFLQRLVE